MQRLFFSVFTAWLALSWSPQSLAASYDADFEYSHERFLSWHDPDWLWLKAQGIAESNLDPLARSHAGAVGVMQFMPGTWADCLRALGINASPYAARPSIICGGWYMRRMLLGWTAERSRLERWRWSWAAYNWGFGNVLKAQRRAGGSLDIADLSLPAETQAYILRIATIKAKLRTP